MTWTVPPPEVKPIFPHLVLAIVAGPVILLGAVAGVLPFLASALFGVLNGGDTSLYLKNTSAQAYYLSVDQTDRGISAWVVKVPGDVDGFALSWSGGPHEAVRLLARDCKPVGQFHQVTDGTWVVDAAPAVTARIESHGRSPFGEQPFEYTSDCGGFMSAFDGADRVQRQ